LAVEQLTHHDEFLPKPIPDNFATLDKIIFKVMIQNPEGVTFETEPEEYSVSGDTTTTATSAITAYETRTTAC
jgi:hypothetical protein